MNLSQEIKYNKDVFETYAYSENETWDVEEYFSEGSEEEIELEDDFEIRDDINLLFGFTTDYDVERAKAVAAKIRERKEKFKKLISVVKKDYDEASEETIITPEEDVGPLKETISESSIHPCLRDIDISDSQMKLTNLYATYPIPDDPGLIPAFWMVTERPLLAKTDGVYTFADLAKKRHLRPIYSIEKMLESDEINLRYYGIDPRIVRVICEAIKDNATIHTLDLTDNWLSEDSCYHLNELLKENHVLNTLILSGCRIGPEGAKKLYDGIATSPVLITLDLSACNLNEEAINILVSAVSINENLENFLLANNSLDEKCASDLRYLISYSKTIKQLNLSWNSLYSAATWKILVQGFGKNDTIINLNLSWNALNNECVLQLCNVLRTSILEELNLSGNRFDENDAILISKVLPKNKTLRRLYLGNNPLKSEGARILILSLMPEVSPESQLYLLDLENVWVNKDISPELETIENEKPWLEIKLGGIFSNYILVGPNVGKILLKRAKYEAMMPKRKKSRKNFGHFVLTLLDKPISKGHFRKLIQKFKLKLSHSLVDEIIKAFPGPKNTVDQGLLKATYLEEYPDTTLPLVKPSKKKGKRLKTDIAKIIKMEEIKKPIKKIREIKTKKEKKQKPIKVHLMDIIMEEEMTYSKEYLYYRNEAQNTINIT